MRPSPRRTKRTLNRRGFLRASAGLGALGILAPFLTSTPALAKPLGSSASRVVFVTFPDGLEEGWFPTSTLDGHTLPPVLEALTPHKQKLLILGGLKGGLESQLEAHGQGPASLWTGSKVRGDMPVVTAPSLDQLLAPTFSQHDPFASLHFGTRSEVNESFGGIGYMHHLGPNQPVPPQDDPMAMYTTLFGSAPNRDDTEALAQARAREQSVLDFVKGRLDKLQPELAAADRPKLEAHLEGVRALERSMDALAQARCELDYPKPPIEGLEEARTDANFPTVVDIQTDLLVLALKCGLTHVATLQYSNTGGGIRIPGVNESNTLHEVMHNRPKTERVRINTWFMERFASLLDKLDAVTFEDGSTLLDDTLVVCSSEMGTGNHTNDPHPFFIAGGDESYFKLGRWLELEGYPRHTRVLTSVMHALGQRQVEAVGDFTDVLSKGPLLEAQG